ncbi:Prefoldin subunit 1, partial [Eschrichtius robustus]|nr:Prefoldin subunit 1 [Eschrichtius robustus]
MQGARAFTELQAKVIDTQQKVKLADIQIEQLNRTKKHAHLTDTEIMTLVDETNMYEGVGRMLRIAHKFHLMDLPPSIGFELSVEKEFESHVDLNML